MGRLLVTGATGFLGGALIRHLRAKGSNPIAFGRSELQCQHLEAEGFDVVRMDLSNLATRVNRAFGPVGAIVHCAALSAPWGPRSAFVAANVTGTKNTCLILRKSLACAASSTFPRPPSISR